MVPVDREVGVSFLATFGCLARLTSAVLTRLALRLGGRCRGSRWRRRRSRWRWRRYARSWRWGSGTRWRRRRCGCVRWRWRRWRGRRYLRRRRANRIGRKPGLRCRTGARRRTAVGTAFMLLDLGTDRIARARRCGATGVALVLAHFAAGLTARADCCVAWSRWRAAGDDLIALTGRRVAGAYLVARQGCRIAWGSLPMTFRRHSGNRLARARPNDPRSRKQCGVCGRRDGRVAVIAVERQRRIFRRRFHVARLLNTAPYKCGDYAGECQKSQSVALLQCTSPFLRKIAARLAERGYVTPSGRPYSASAVASMLG